MKPLVVLGFIMVASAGCYGKGFYGWGLNGTNFEIHPRDGFVEVASVGRGKMKPVAPGGSPEYEEDAPAWSDFALQFEPSGLRAAFNHPANATSVAVPAGQRWSLSDVAEGPVRVGHRIHFCQTEWAPAPVRFSALMDAQSQADHSLRFEQVPGCL